MPESIGIHQTPVTASRTASRRAALVTLARAFPGRTAAVLGLGAVVGTLPVLFAATTGLLISAMPRATRDGFASAAGHRLTTALVLLGLITIAAEVVSAGLGYLTNDLYRRFDEHVLARVMAACLRPAWTGHLDDPAVQEQITLAAAAARFGPGEFISGLSTKWVLRVEGIGAVVLIALRFSPVAALALTAVWLLYGNRLCVAYFRANPFWTSPMRQAWYLRAIGVDASTAKEVRVFGLRDWVLDRYGQRWADTMQGLWRARRIDHQAMVVIGVLLLGVHLIVLRSLIDGALAGRVSLGALAVTLQALVTAAGLGAPEGDVWVENGAVPIPAVLRLEQTLARLAPAGGELARRDTPSRSIRLEDVRFRYSGRSTDVLCGIDLEIAAGESLALVGDNGAGKTTLVSLIAGLYLPTDGRIVVDGIDWRHSMPRAGAARSRRSSRTSRGTSSACATTCAPAWVDARSPTVI